MPLGQLGLWVRKFPEFLFQENFREFSLKYSIKLPNNCILVYIFTFYRLFQHFCALIVTLEHCFRNQLCSWGRWICRTWKWRTKKDQRLENAGPGKWRTKSQGWKMQDLENDGPNRRAGKCRTWKMTDQIAGLENAGPGKWRTQIANGQFITLVCI